MNYINTYPLKATLLKALRTMFAGYLIQESFLRTEQVIQNSVQSYNFDIYNQTTPLSTENRLDKNDSMFCYAVGLGLYTRNTSNLDQGKQPLQFYPNESYFAAVAGSPAFVPSDLETMYNGKLSIKRGNNVILESFPTRRFRNVSATQQTSSSNKSSAFAEDMLVPVVTPIQLPGQEQTAINLTLPTYNSIAWQAQGANLENRVALVFEGFLVKGVKNVISDEEIYKRVGL